MVSGVVVVVSEEVVAVVEGEDSRANNRLNLLWTSKVLRSLDHQTSRPPLPLPT
jgi:hypothetical protein